MSANSFGHLFRYTTFGESHGPAIGCVVDGVPPRLELSADDIQVYLDKRRPGQSRHTSQRQEADRVEILSGVFEGQTTGAPIGLLIVNQDSRSKDYDAIKGEGPTRWRLWDLTNWGFLAAFADQRRVGGAIIAWQTEGIDMLEGRADLAVLWDIRVAPDVRGQGVGARLIDHVERWARARDCRTLKIETQNINVPACRFYARSGCTLGAVFLHAYPELPEEVQMLWYKDLASQA